MIPQDHSLLKSIFLLLVIVVGLAFLGGIAVSNWPMQQAEATAVRWAAQDEHDFNQRTLDARAGVEIDRLWSQWENERRLLNEQYRMLVERNTLQGDARRWLVEGAIGLGLLLVGGLVVVVLYTLAMAAQRWVNRRLPLRPPVTIAATAAQAGADSLPARPRDPWRDPAFVARKRREARELELEAIRQRRAPAPPVIVTYSSNGHGPQRAPRRQVTE